MEECGLAWSGGCSSSRPSPVCTAGRCAAHLTVGWDDRRDSRQIPLLSSYSTAAGPGPACTVVTAAHLALDPPPLLLTSPDNFTVSYSPQTGSTAPQSHSSQAPTKHSGGLPAIDSYQLRKTKFANKCLSYNFIQPAQPRNAVYLIFLSILFVLDDNNSVDRCDPLPRTARPEMSECLHRSAVQQRGAHLARRAVARLERQE